MEKFLENWTYSKHAAATTGVYIGIATIGNAVLGRKIPEDEKSLQPVEVYRNLTKKQKLFNCILSACYAFDMSVTYLAINHFKKNLNK